jgi:hypothetical protein
LHICVVLLPAVQKCNAPDSDIQHTHDVSVRAEVRTGR